MYQADAGGWIDLSAVLDLAEMGAPEGLRGQIVSVGLTPEIEDGPGRVVMTTVNHLSNFVSELTVADASGQLDRLGVTGWHKFFRERRGWVSACELELGEKLRGHDGPVVVTSLVRDPDVQRVYNLTVEADHVYYVGDFSTLAHNNGCYDVTNIGGRQVGRYRSIGGHHMIRNEAVEGVLDATKGGAPAIDLGPWQRGMPHPLTRGVQTLRGGGTYAAERRIGYRALRRAGLTSAEARSAIEDVADRYFIDELGWTMQTKTRIPADRIRPR
jgi:hypothetical protein